MEVRNDIPEVDCVWGANHFEHTSSERTMNPKIFIPFGEIHAYDANGNVSELRDPSATQTTTYHYDNWNVIAEKTTTSETTTAQTHTWGLDLSNTLQSAGGVGGLLQSKTTTGETTNVHHYLYDANGNVSELIKPTGELDAHYQYDPFGKETTSTGPTAQTNPYRFSTKPWDNVAELNYYGYRFYSPQMGRWLNRDPIDEMGGENLYNFVGNNPLGSFDVAGLLTASQAFWQLFDHWAAPNDNASFRKLYDPEWSNFMMQYAPSEGIGVASRARGSYLELAKNILNNNAPHENHTVTKNRYFVRKGNVFFSDDGLTLFLNVSTHTSNGNYEIDNKCCVRFYNNRHKVEDIIDPNLKYISDWPLLALEILSRYGWIGAPFPKPYASFQRFEFSAEWNAPDVKYCKENGHPIPILRSKEWPFPNYDELP